MGQRLYVGNLSYQTTEEGLQAAFAAAGEVTSVKIVTDRETGRPRGFGFVEMASEAAAKAAIQALHGSQLDGRTLTVNEAQEKPNTGGGFRSGGGGGGDRRGPPRGGPSKGGPPRGGRRF